MFKVLKKPYSTLLHLCEVYSLTIDLDTFSGSVYTTIALAFERLEAMSIPKSLNRRNASIDRPIDKYPTKRVGFCIAAASIVFNAPRYNKEI